MNNGVKEFHLVAEPVIREIAPGMKAHLWGYNGQSPGPTIEAVEGDRVRIFVTNKLPEHTTIHWHGQRLPNGMDGVGGLTPAADPGGKTFVYEFVAKKPGTFMYHPHADEMAQMAMGMMGFWVTHPKAKPQSSPVDRDFVLPAERLRHRSRQLHAQDHHDARLQSVDVEQPRFSRHRSAGRCDTNDQVRIRIGNLTMTNHPIHLHGHDFVVTGTDGGWAPGGPLARSHRGCRSGTDARDRIRGRRGDWAFHCHKSHHTMNAMGHDVPTMIGVDHREVAKKINSSFPTTW